MNEDEDSEYRREILEKAKQGHNLAVIGAAGTGKTFLVQSIVKALENAGKSVQVTATIGAACEAYEIQEAATLDSFCDICPGRSADSIVQKLINNPAKRDKINSTDALVIDEISMWSAAHLELVEYILRSVRANAVPFGGIQWLWVILNR